MNGKETNEAVVLTTAPELEVPQPDGEHIAKMRSARKTKLSQLTRRKNILKELMKDNMHTEEFEENMAKYKTLLDEFKDAHLSYHALLNDPDEINTSDDWFQSKLCDSNDFFELVTLWKADPTTRLQPDDIALGDSASVMAAKANSSMMSKRSSHSSVASARIRAEAEKAAAIAKLQALKEKHVLEEEEENLKKQMEKIRKRKETLNVQADLDAANAKIHTLTIVETHGQVQSESAPGAAPPPAMDRMNEYLDKGGKMQEKESEHTKKEAIQSNTNMQSVRAKEPQYPPKPFFCSPHGAPPPPPPEYFIQKQYGGTLPDKQLHTTQDKTSKQTQSHASQLKDDNKMTKQQPPMQDATLYNILQKQTEITASLVSQHVHSSLPRKEIKVFEGDPVEYRSFMRAFEHFIEAKTSSGRDRLHYLEQYTRGQSRDLVRTCLYMEPERGYQKARELLQEHYGNQFKIANAYIEKALSWSPIKPEDPKALEAFGLYLRGCCNAMEEITYMEELDLSSNLKALVIKLPYKIRERWRSEVCVLQERRSGKVRFCDLVRFLESQVKILTDPVFGNIQDPNAPKSSKPTILRRPKSFATSITNTDSQSPQSQDSSQAASKPFCLFCSGAHTMDACHQFKRKLHKDKIEFLKERGICFGCLVQGHMSNTCHKRLSCKDCKLKHPTVLHIGRRKRTEPETPETSQSETSSQASASPKACGRIGAGEEECVLSIVPVKVKSSKGNQIIQTYAFLDPGSSASFCTNSLMHQLNIRGKRTNILLRTMGQEKTVSSHIVAGLEVSELHGNTFTALPEFYTQKTMPVTKHNIPNQSDVSKWPYLKNIKLPTIDADIGLLIGTNAPKVMEPQEVINSQGEGPYAVRTLLGWVVNGPLRGGGTKATSVNRISVVDLHDLLVTQYNTDFVEKSYEEKREMSIEDKQFLKSVEDSTTIVNGHYSFRLPFRSHDVSLPNNRQVAEQRLWSLKRKFLKNASFHEEYTRFLSDVIEQGYAEAVPQGQLKQEDGKVWYIPHHGVYHPKKGKLRVVFDCGASFKGTSLNSELLQGPDLIKPLIGVLTRFRQEPIAIMGDIQAMFHQVKVAKQDVNFLRFLWWPGGDIGVDPLEYRMVVHLFGAVSSPSCANYALRRTAEDNRNQLRPEVTDTILNNIYVDDCLKSVATEDEAIRLIKELTAACQRGGFHFSKWITNSRKVLSSVPEADRAKEVKELNLDRDRLPTERALGVQWCVEDDNFTFNVTTKSQPHTRRGILSEVSSIYDPLGFLAPFTLPAKLLLQELCSLNLGWDEEIPKMFSERWLKWKMDLQKITNFKVRRCLKPNDFGKPIQAQLHHFADASEQGYGTVSYLRLKNDKNIIHVSFMMGKARVAPLKKMTIPRMELAAAVLATKVDKLLRRELQLQLESSMFWTDSQSVLKYIANQHTRFHTFVANRVSTIREATKVTQWRYVNTKVNPADVASRGQNAEKFMENQSWIHGPDILWKSESDWPEFPMDVISHSFDDPEVKRNPAVNTIMVKDNGNPTDRFLTHFSSWKKLKIAVAWILKLKETLKVLVHRKKEFRSTVSASNTITRSTGKVVDEKMTNVKTTLGGQTVTLEDLEKAENAIISQTQKQYFQEEMTTLKTATSGVKKASSIYKLDPVFKDDVLRVGGRLSRASMPEESKFPVILPKQSHVSTLILRHIHEKTGHGGRNHILSELRKKYWIIKANSAARKILSECITCRRHRTKVGEQKMADLPQERLEPDLPPFSNVGVDYFGPIETKRGRTILKRYGVIFTCMTSRAVHIEVANSLDTDSCLNALRRFICRRGQVKHIRSDNGTNFVGTQRELKEALAKLNQQRIQGALLQKGIQWSFNSPGASHHGGVWERLIKSVRQVLHAVLKQQTLDDEGLQTLLCEVEAILNSRPITTVSNDPQDLEPLTPNHILLFNTKPILPPGVFDKNDLYVRRRWKQVQYMSDLFWKRWCQEYLPLMQERQKWCKRRRSFTPGDVVMIVDPCAPRGSWILGRVLEVMADSKGLVRAVKVKTQTNVLERPITKICLLLECEE